MARILVVDDVRFILQMIASIFQDRGHEVLTAEGGVAALEIAARERPDLMLLDVAMPGMDGIEVAQRIREKAATREIPILLVTAQGDSKTMARAAEVGVDDHVTKPFETPVLLAKAAKLLGGYRMYCSLQRFGNVGVLTALRSAVDQDIAEHLEAALKEADGTGDAVVLDLGRIRKVDLAAVAALVKYAGDRKKGSAPLCVVAPGKGVGTRALASGLQRAGKLFPSRAEAMKGASWDGREPEKPAPPEEPGDAAKEAPADPPQPASAAPCVMDVLGKVVMVRVVVPSLGKAISHMREELRSRREPSVVVTLRRVREVDAEGLDGLRDLAVELMGTGRKLRIVDPEPGVEDALRKAGLGPLVAPSSNGAAATRESSTRASS